MEDQEPPAALVVEDVKTQKNEQGQEEKIGTVHRYQVQVGIRNRQQRLVEVIDLEDPEKKTVEVKEDTLGYAELAFRPKFETKAVASRIISVYQSI